MRRLLPLVSSLALLLTLAPAAHARWFAAERVDGPAALERAVVDLGIEEGGGLTYLKRDAAGSRAWLSRLQNGRWTAPAALSGAGATESVVAAGERGRLAAAWIQNGTVYGALIGTPATALSAPGGASGLSIEMGITGVAYAVWSQGGDIRAARLAGTAWRAVPVPLDIDPARAAGGGTSRPRVAVAADGSAVVVWGETLPDGRTHVFARRLYDLSLSALPQDATLVGPTAGSADSPEVDVEYDRSFAWVSFRQDVAGISRTVARRLRASSFQEPYALDAALASSGADVTISGAGVGHAVSVSADGRLLGALLRDDVLRPAVRSDVGGAVSAATVVTSERDDSALLWRAGAEAAAVVRGRLAPDSGRLGAAKVLSRAGAGPVAPGPLSASSNRIGDVAVAIVQGAAGARTVGVAAYDLPPSAPTLRSIPDVVRPRVLVRWTAGQEFGGPQRYGVLIDGRRVKTTGRTSFRTRRLRPGRHRVQVVALDRRGQRSAIGRRQTFVVR